MSEEIYADDFELCCNGKVLRVREYRQYMLNGYPTPERQITAVRFECADCNKPVARLRDRDREALEQVSA